MPEVQPTSSTQDWNPNLCRQRASIAIQSIPLLVSCELLSFVHICEMWRPVYLWTKPWFAQKRNHNSAAKYDGSWYLQNKHVILPQSVQTTLYQKQPKCSRCLCFVQRWVHFFSLSRSQKLLLREWGGKQLFEATKGGNQLKITQYLIFVCHYSFEWNTIICGASPVATGLNDLADIWYSGKEFLQHAESDQPTEWLQWVERPLCSSHFGSKCPSKGKRCTSHWQSSVGCCLPEDDGAKGFAFGEDTFTDTSLKGSRQTEAVQLHVFDLVSTPPSCWNLININIAKELINSTHQLVLGLDHTDERDNVGHGSSESCSKVYPQKHIKQCPCWRLFDVAKKVKPQWRIPRWQYDVIAGITTWTNQVARNERRMPITYATPAASAPLSYALLSQWRSECNYIHQHE